MDGYSTTACGVARVRRLYRGARGCESSRVRTRSSKHLALWMAIALIGCGSSTPDRDPAVQGEAGGTITGVGGSGGSGTAIVTPGDASTNTSESGASIDATDPVTPTDEAASDAGLKAFTHPGILVNRAELDLVKSKLAVDPYKSAFAQANTSRFGSLSYASGPIAVVECGSFSNPDIGCTAEKNDATAAYTQALLWYLTGQEAHRQKGDRDHERMVGPSQGSHQQQRAAAVGVDRVGVPARSRDHSLHLRRVGRGRRHSLRCDAERCLPPQGHQR